MEFVAPPLSEFAIELLAKFVPEALAANPETTWFSPSDHLDRSHVDPDFMDTYPYTFPPDAWCVTYMDSGIPNTVFFDEFGVFKRH